MKVNWSSINVSVVFTLENIFKLNERNVCIASMIFKWTFDKLFPLQQKTCFWSDYISMLCNKTVFHVMQERSTHVIYPTSILPTCEPEPVFVNRCWSDDEAGALCLENTDSSRWMPSNQRPLWVSRFIYPESLCVELWLHAFPAQVHLVVLSKHRGRVVRGRRGGLKLWPFCCLSIFGCKGNKKTILNTLCNMKNEWSKQ